MTWNDRLAEEDDPVVAWAIGDFKACVDAWSQAALSRPRTAAKTVRRSWRLVAAWALGCAVAAASAGGAWYEHRRQLEQARIAAARAAAQAAAQEKLSAGPSSARETDQDLLAAVDNDISRAVPAAMEPLAQMMDSSQADGNGTKSNKKK